MSGRWCFRAQGSSQTGAIDPAAGFISNWRGPTDLDETGDLAGVGWGEGGLVWGFDEVPRSLVAIFVRS